MPGAARPAVPHLRAGVERRLRGRRRSPGRARCPNARAQPPAACARRPTALSIARRSAAVSSTDAAPTFSSRWRTCDVPGIGSITGERCSSHASASCDRPIPAAAIRSTVRPARSARRAEREPGDEPIPRPCRGRARPRTRGRKVVAVLHVTTSTMRRAAWSCATLTSESRCGGPCRRSASSGARRADLRAAPSGRSVQLHRSIRSSVDGEAPSHARAGARSAVLRPAAGPGR